MDNTKTDRIRDLNDDLRKNLATGTAVITPEIAALGQEAVERIVKTTSSTTVYDPTCGSGSLLLKVGR